MGAEYAPGKFALLQRFAPEYEVSELGASRRELSCSEAAAAKYRMRRFQEVMIGSNILTVDELSEYLQVHRTTIYRLLKQGKLPGFRVGSDWRFNLEAIDRWCLEQGKPTD